MRQFVCTSLDGAWNRGSSRWDNRVIGGGCMFVLLLLAAFSPAQCARGDDETSVEQIAAGRELFLREWQVNDRRSVEGDGLGPMYNAASCAKCHRLGGIGGAGANDENVDLLTLKPPRNAAVNRDALRQQVAEFHPALAMAQLSATTVLHRFSPDPNYAAWRGRFLSESQRPRRSLAHIVAVITEANKHPDKETIRVGRLEGMAYQHSERNTPALFGAGLIDRLPDSVFEELERRPLAKSGGVSGRLPRTASGKIGRFGWRGQTESLQEFVLGACAVELGLEAPGHSQPMDPLQVVFDRPLTIGRHDLDISNEQCTSLTQFVANLPPPRQVIPTDEVAAQTVARGERQFENIGCADCHVRQVADISGIYSDLLLHDLGRGLEDPVPANSPRGSGSGSYYGGADSLFAQVAPEQRREWRTPPLWGLRDSAPYLHDGRAQTFSEAIAWHGGEAAKSARDFRELQQNKQAEVFAFLNSLAAPAPESLTLETVVPENVVLAGE